MIAIVGTKEVVTVVPLKNSNSFRKTIEKSLINYEINLILTWSTNYAITNPTGAVTFGIRDIKT